MTDKSARAALAALLLVSLALTGCGEEQFMPEGYISVLSREDGSGTRGAFVELLGIEELNADGLMEDMTTPYADVTNSTSVTLTSVGVNPAAIGYVSAGSLNDTVKVLSVNGVLPSAQSVADGSYPLARGFNIALAGEPDALTADFIGYILSAEGQEVVSAAGYFPAVHSPEPYTGIKPSGSISAGGSSSVCPVMEKLIEAYLAINPNASIELQQSDSTTGLAGAADGVFEIGLSSRELKDSELAKGLQPTVIALDAIAVIVNPKNPLDDISAARLADIYTGRVERWSEASGGEHGQD